MLNCNHSPNNSSLGELSMNTGSDMFVWTGAGPVAVLVARGDGER